jgi:hypothetical protein
LENPNNDAEQKLKTIGAHTLEAGIALIFIDFETKVIPYFFKAILSTLNAFGES